MTEPFDGLPTYSSLSSDRDQPNIDNTSTSYIPISDFRRNEARPILPDDDRHKSIYHQPGLIKYNSTERRRRRHRRSQPSGESANATSRSAPSNEPNDSSEIDNPSARIQFLLGDEDQDDDDEEHKPHDLFIELNELRCEGEKINETGEPIDQGWKETARWVKFEEDVESGGRWSKPHVATLSLHSLLELRNCILNGSVILDMQTDQLPIIIDMILDNMVSNNSLPSDKKLVTRNALLLKHIHQHDKEFHRHLHTQESRKPLPFTRSLAELTRIRSQKDVTLSSVDQMATTIAATPVGTMTHNLTLTNKQESFAALIGIIFIYEAFDKMIEINHHRPVRLHTNKVLSSNCSCLISDRANGWNSKMTINDCYKIQSYQFIGSDCKNINDKTYIPDVFFFSIILFVSTFVLAYTLKNFKFGRFLPMNIRTKVSDFGVVLAIFINVLIDYLIGLDTPKLNVPRKFATTKEDRGWIINPFGKNPMYLWFAALLPALLATILIFMDQQITAVIINRKENKLKKGCGYHLDLLIVAICIAINSVLGLPWFVAATVLSINHVIALKLESETAAPGEKPKFLGVREQRVTGFIVFLFIGLSVFLTKFLGFIPMPVLYGVFLYMGISSMKEIQLISRILLIFMPEKYQPDYVYLRYVRTRRVHMFTIIQLSCLILLWIIKSIKSISILFPIMVLALVGARKAMDYIFTQRELGYLDDVMPEVVKKEIEERRNSILPDNIDDTNKTNETIAFDSEKTRTESDAKTVLKAPTKNVQNNQSTNVMNFSEEVGKTFIWKSIAKSKDKEGIASEKKSSSNDKSSRSSGIKKRIGKLSLGFLSSDEDRSLVNTNNPQLPSIVIEPMEPSVANSEQQSRRTSVDKTNSDFRL
ncbi:unnamed protein product [Rotaria sp. Silwood1]|nr:unnamed protein product [Rotaria sp. Silwood1]